MTNLTNLEKLFIDYLKKEIVDCDVEHKAIVEDIKEYANCNGVSSDDLEMQRRLF